MVQGGMGIGLMPNRDFDVVGQGMNLRSTPLVDPSGRSLWSIPLVDRPLTLVVRDAERLSTTSRLMFQPPNHADAGHTGVMTPREACSLIANGALAKGYWISKCTRPILTNTTIKECL
jgi:hypothetical protein